MYNEPFRKSHGTFRKRGDSAVIRRFRESRKDHLVGLRLAAGERLIAVRSATGAGGGMKIILPSKNDIKAF